MQIEHFSRIDDYPLQVEFERGTEKKQRKRKHSLSNSKQFSNSYSTLSDEKSMIEKVFLGNIEIN